MSRKVLTSNSSDKNLNISMSNNTITQSPNSITITTPTPTSAPNQNFYSPANIPVDANTPTLPSLFNSNTLSLNNKPKLTQSQSQPSGMSVEQQNDQHYEQLQHHQQKKHKSNWSRIKSR